MDDEPLPEDVIIDAAEADERELSPEPEVD